MKEWLDDIRVEIQTLKACICRLSEQIDELERKLEKTENLSTPTPVADDPVSIASVPSPRLNDRVKSSTSLRHAFSLNDSFRFTRELFEGNAARMNRLLDVLNEADSLEKALELFCNEVSVPEDNEAMTDFMELLRKHFNEVNQNGKTVYSTDTGREPR